MTPTKTSDPCCFVCKSPSGVCLSRFKCEHHIEARRDQDREDMRATIGYRDPVGDQAVNNVMRQQRRRK